MRASQVHLTKEQLAQAREGKVREAQAVLAAEVAKLRSGEDWQRYLELTSRFHKYSPGNALLIVSQHEKAYRERRVPDPDPGLVAGYRAWQALGRQVEKGQKGYVVLAPLRFAGRRAVDSEGNKRSLRRDEAPKPGEQVEQVGGIRGWTVEHVWSVHQTSGAPLPEAPMPKLLVGQAPPGLVESATALLGKHGYRIEYVADARAIGGANGTTTPSEKLVRVRSDMDEAARAKTLVHELAHVLLHAEGPERDMPRHRKEVEAESVAYVVCRAHGMDSNGYSFPYVAHWAGDDVTKEVQATQARVGKAARQILDASTAEHGLGGRPPAPAVAPEAPATLPVPEPGLSMEVA